MKKLLILILVKVVLVSSCQKEHHLNSCSDTLVEKVPIDFYIHTTVNDLEFFLNDSLYKDYLGRNYRVELLKFYLSNVVLEKHNGIMDTIGDVFLIDESVDDDFFVQAIVNPGSYVNLHFGIGLDSLQNNSDPSLFEITHPLSIAQNTYWTWATKYKFFMLEGRVDTIGGESPNHIFSYHSGFDNLYRQISLPIEGMNIVLNSSSNSLQIHFDLAKVLAGDSGVVDFIEEPFSHSQADIDIVEKISNNLQSSFSVSFY